MISIVIPAYNEDREIAITIHACKNVLEGLGLTTGEVIVVDDCSKDNTARLAEENGAIVVRHPHNIGYGRSLKDGIQKAKNDIICITDADGTYPIDKIPQLYEEYQKGFDMVVGARQGKFYIESTKKSILRFILKKLVEFTAGRSIPDINSGLRMFSKKTVVPYFGTLSNTFSFTTSVTLAYMMTGKFVKYIPIDYYKRTGKTNVKLVNDSLRTLQFIVEAILFYNPIKIFLVFCGVLIFLGMFSLAVAFFLKISLFYFLGIGCLLLSILMFGLGLIATLLKQILQKQNHA
ncbi:MAG: glycosyltransferase family 2 protein [Chitinophagales bacterium]|nr:glycosyltransferase family 2 protein [Chitinophagales bacterium]